MKAGEFLNNLASLSGLSSDNEALKSILAAQSFSEVDIPDEVANQINGNLLTIESAKNNTDLIKHFRGSILGSLDARINDVMNNHSSIFTDDVQSKIQNIQSSYDKVTELAKLLAEKQQASTGGDSKELDALKSQVEQLNGQITEFKTKEQTMQQEFEQKLTAKDMGYADNAVLSSLKFADALDKKDYIQLTQTKIDQKAQELGIVKQFENGQIVLKKQEGDTFVDYYNDNKKISYSDFAEQIAAEHKFLNVGGTPPPATPPATPPQGGAPEVSTSKYTDAVENAASDLNGGGQS